MREPIAPGVDSIPIGLAEIRAAQARIAGLAIRTPLLSSDALSAATGARVYVKAESLQPMGAFKIRGAANRLRQLGEAERQAGVVTASSGNHAQAVAYTARALGLRAVVVIPETSPELKAAACRAYGAEVVRHGQVWEDAWARAQAISAERGLALIHPFDDWAIIAGQATCALEILEDLPDADVILAPIGGGGLIAGLAIGTKAVRPATRVVGVQASGAASSVLSWRARQPVPVDDLRTIAEGIKTRLPGVRNFAAMLAGVDDMVTVEDADLIQAALFTIEKVRLTAELSGVAGIAALLSGRFQAPGQRVVAVLSGGNLSLDTLAELLAKR